MKKYYILYGFVNAKDFYVNKKFKTRDKAIEAALRLLPLLSQVEEENEIKEHVIEYKCNKYTRFTIARQNA